MKAKKYNMGGPMPQKKKPGQPAPYDDSGVPLGGPKGPKPSPRGPMPVPSGGPRDSVIVDPAKKKKRAPMRMEQGSGGAMPMMKKGGKVRGAGCATQGTRKAKMVTMKGA